MCDRQTVSEKERDRVAGKTGNKSDCMKMEKDEKTNSSEDNFIPRFICQTFYFLDLQQSVWIIKWNENDEKVLKFSISVCNVLFQIYTI